MKIKFNFNIQKKPPSVEVGSPQKQVAVTFKIDGQEVSRKEVVWDLLHPDQLVAKTLYHRIANVTCELHPIQCRHLTVKVAGGKLELENVCCDAFRQKVLQALQTEAQNQPPPA